MGAKAKFGWVLMLLILFSMEAVGQNFDINQISTNEGLPSGQIGYVQQDEKGDMWLTTYDGLIRYNGFDSKVLTVEDGLRNNIINAVYYDSEERLWIAAESGGVGYLKADSLFYKDELAALDSLSVMYITEDSSGQLYFSTYGYGLFTWDGQTLNQITTEQGLPSNIVWEIHISEKDEIWVATQEGVALMKEGEVSEVITTENGLSGWGAYSIAEEVDGTIWVATSKGLSKYDGEEWEKITQINGDELLYVYYVLVDREGIVWIGTESNGIYWFDGSDYTHIKKANGLSSNYIYSMYEDNSGRVWVSTDENGVNVFRSRDFKIFSGSHLSGEESVTIIHQEDDALWLGTENGLTYFEENGTHRIYVFPDELAIYKEVWDIAELQNGNLLVLNNYNKLLEFDGENFTDYGNSISLPYIFIKDIHLRQGALWMATESGVVKYENDKYTYFNTEDGLSDNFVWSLFEDTEGSMWAATDKGVSRFDEESVFTIDLEDGLDGSLITFITQSPQGKYYAGTNVGFTEFEIREDTVLTDIRNFTLDPEFLPEPMFILFDEEGNLWQGTNAGLHFFDSKTLSETKPGIIEGLFYPLQDYGLGVEFNFLSALKADNGTLWFGSFTHGLIEYSGATPEPDSPPKPFLRGISVNGVEIENIENKEYIFSHDRDNLKLQIGAYHYEDPERVFYEYRLSGSEENWRKVFNKKEVNYTHLPPGTYSFEVRTKSVKSNWGDPVTLSAFTIQKPFWNTAWFYMLVVVLIIGLLYATFKMYLIYYEKKKLDTMVDQKTEALQQALSDKDMLIKEIHHRVKNNMFVISGLLDLQAWKMPEGEARNAIENSKLRLQAMASIHEKLYKHDNLSNIDFKSFAEDLVEQIAETLQGKDQNISVNLDIESGRLDIHTAIPCGLILNEALSNCFEHGFKGKKEGNIDIVFEVMETNYKLMIADDGVGIPKEMMNGKASSLGITLIRSLASQMDAEVSFKSESGTSIHIFIPKN